MVHPSGCLSAPPRAFDEDAAHGFQVSAYCEVCTPFQILHGFMISDLQVENIGFASRKYRICKVFEFGASSLAAWLRFILGGIVSLVSWKGIVAFEKDISVLSFEIFQAPIC